MKQAKTKSVTVEKWHVLLDIIDPKRGLCFFFVCVYIYIYIYIYIYQGHQKISCILPKEELVIESTLFKEINNDGSFYVSEDLSISPSLLIAAPRTFSLPESLCVFPLH